jgi:hypothetical protein
MVFELRSAAEAPFVPLLILTANTAVVNPAIVIKEKIITTAMNDIVPIIVSSLLSAVICHV